MSETGGRRASRATALPVLHLRLDRHYVMVRHGLLLMACCESFPKRGTKSRLNKIVAKWVELRLFAEAC
jgi:hypothetical protein